MPPKLVDFGDFARDRALGQWEADSLVERLRLVRVAAGTHLFALTIAEFDQLESRLREALATFHHDNPDLPGIGRERLRLQLAPRLPAPAFVAILRDMARAGGIALDGAWVRCADHVVRLSPRDEALWDDIRPLLAGPSRFRPPRVRDIAGELGIAEPEIRRLLKQAGRMGLVDEVAHDHFFLRATIAELVGVLSRLGADLPRGEFTAARFRDQLDSGRKVAIQILEFFDRHGVTLRRGDLRRVNGHRLDLFGVTADGGESSPVGRPDFKSGWGREPAPGGFDSHSLPPIAGPAPRPGKHA